MLIGHGTTLGVKVEICFFYTLTDGCRFISSLTASTGVAVEITIEGKVIIGNRGSFLVEIWETVVVEVIGTSQDYLGTICLERNFISAEVENNVIITCYNLINHPK